MIRTCQSQHPPESHVTVGRAALWAERTAAGPRLAVLAPHDDPLLERFTGERQPDRGDDILILCPMDAPNAAALRTTLPWLAPVPLGLATSAGFGDRLGVATPGHVRALRATARIDGAGSISPIFAQQSIREMQRTDRTPVDVLSDATWGAFRTGWRGPVGADADHLKTPEDIDSTAAAGYSFYTIDPGDHVDNEAGLASREALRHRLEALPWGDLEDTPDDLLRRYAGRTVRLEDRAVVLEEVGLARAAAKYGAAVAHVCRLYRRLAGKGIPFELEMSVDETDTPTSHLEHVYIASELRRLGVRWVSLAPRFVGRFEKGIDYIGDLDRLRADLAGHAAIAHALGPYKLSLHSGSDKFSVYPLIAEATAGLTHLKTAGTSYLEALRVASRLDPALFRAVLDFARAHYTVDRATYHVSAELERVPEAASIPDDRLPALLDDVHARQVLHVTFGSTLTGFRPQILKLLRRHEEAYAEGLENHFVRHLAPFAPFAPGAERTA